MSSYVWPKVCASKRRMWQSVGVETAERAVSKARQRHPDIHTFTGAAFPSDLPPGDDHQRVCHHRGAELPWIRRFGQTWEFRLGALKHSGLVSCVLGHGDGMIGS